MDESKVTSAPHANNLPVKELMSDSWNVSLKTILRFIVIGVIGMLVGLFLMLVAWIVAGGVLGSMIGLDKLSAAFSGEDTYLWLEILSNRTLQITAGAILIVYVLIAYTMQSLVSIAMIMAIDTVGQPFSLGIVLKKAKSILLPFMLLQIFLGVLYIGSFFFFFIPMLLVIFFLIFANYEIVLNNQSPLNALRRSVYLVTKNFGHVFVAILILLGLQTLFQSLPGIIAQVLDDESFAGVFILFFIFYFVASFIFTWFTTVFMVLVYKHVRSVSGNEGKGHVWWMWIVALLGWLVIAGIVFFSYKFAGTMIERLKQLPTETQETEELGYVSSGCGLDLGFPDTHDNYEGGERKWVFQEYPANRDAFPLLDEKTLPTQNVQTTFFKYWDSERYQNEDQNLKIYPGLYIRCADNPRGLTLETFSGLLESNPDLDVEIVKENAFKSDNGVDLEFFNILFTEDGEEYKDPGYIGVSQDGKKLIYIIYYSAEDEDPNKEQIDNDIDRIFNSLRYGSTYTLPPLTTKAPPPKKAAPVYTPAPTIKPGELGSQEWMDNFNKEFEETKKRTEESKAKMCADNPDFC